MKMTIDEMIRSGALEAELQSRIDAGDDDADIAEEMIKKVAKRRKQLQKSGGTADFSDILKFAGFQAYTSTPTNGLSKHSKRSKQSDAVRLAVTMSDLRIMEIAKLRSEYPDAFDSGDVDREIKTRLNRGLELADGEMQRSYAMALAKYKRVMRGQLVTAGVVQEAVPKIQKSNLIADKNQLLQQLVAASIGKPTSLQEPQSNSLPNTADEWDRLLAQILGSDYEGVLDADLAGEILADITAGKFETGTTQTAKAGGFSDLIPRLAGDGEHQGDVDKRRAEATRKLANDGQKSTPLWIAKIAGLQ